jgi:GMP synthase-like glutamine amidotransferase
MNRDILILRNVTRENPGLLETVLKENELSYLIVDTDNLTGIKPLNTYKAIIVLGGPDSANDSGPKMQNELALIRNAVNTNIPFLGICLGLQTLVKAMGGEVIKCKTSEVGFRDLHGEFFKVRLTPEGKDDKLFYNLPDELTVFQLHGETVELTPEMTLLATGDYCKNQIVKYGQTAYGIQSHFELTSELLEAWINEDTDLQKLNSDQLRSDFESIKSDYYRVGRQLLVNFLTLAGIIK